MKPDIIQHDRMLLAGVSFFGDPFQLSAAWTEENEIGRLWDRLVAWIKLNKKDLSFDLPKEMYEIHIEYPETEERGHYEIFIGFEIDNIELIPHDLLIKVIPATSFAKFTLHGQEIVSDWSRLIYHNWMSTSGYERAFKFGMQKYDERFKGMDRLEESVIDVLVPVRLKRTNNVRG